MKKDDFLTEKALKKAIQFLLYKTSDVSDYLSGLDEYYENVSLSHKSDDEKIKDFVNRCDFSELLNKLNENMRMLHIFEFGQHTECAAALHSIKSQLIYTNHHCMDTHPLLHDKKCVKIGTCVLTANYDKYHEFECENTYIDVEGNIFNVLSVEADFPYYNESDESIIPEQDTHENLIYIYREKIKINDYVYCFYLDNLFKNIEPLKSIDCDAI